MNFLKLGNSRHNIKLLVTGYVINYLTVDCHMPNPKEGKWPRDFNALGKCLLWVPEPAQAFHGEVRGAGPLRRGWKKKVKPSCSLQIKLEVWKVGREGETGREFPEKGLSRTIIGNPDSLPGKFLLVETGILFIGILNLAHRIRNPSYDWNPEFLEFRSTSTWSPESRSVDSKIQDCRPSLRRILGATRGDNGHYSYLYL